jgi:hypothetical protein
MKTKGKSNCPRKKEKKKEMNWSIAACIGRTYIEAIPMPKLMNVCQHPDTPSTCQNHHEIDSWLYQIVAKETANPKQNQSFFWNCNQKHSICMTKKKGNCFLVKNPVTTMQRPKETVRPNKHWNHMWAHREWLTKEHRLTICSLLYWLPSVSNIKTIFSQPPPIPTHIDKRRKKTRTHTHTTCWKWPN